MNKAVASAIALFSFLFPRRSCDFVLIRSEIHRESVIHLGYGSGNDHRATRWMDFDDRQILITRELGHLIDVFLRSAIAGGEFVR